MFNSLHQFYTSDDWKAVKTQLMLREGMVCEYCHKLIREKYKAIGHHKIPLDMFNVNDYSVSLNLDNLMLVCHKCHNIIHGKGSLGTKHRYLVYGPPLSGKSTFVNDVATKEDLVISVDDIRFGITGGKYHENSNNTLDEVLAVRDFLIDRIKTRGKRMREHNIYIVGGYQLVGEREALINKLELEPVFLDVSREECLARLEACQDGRDHFLWRKYIDKWFNEYSE